jgi:ABC-type hemin transport system substrate-binding protein
MFPPERIICLTEETVETLYLLGEESRIVGISGYVVRPPRARREKPRVSAFTSADIPKILDLKPDLVLTFSDLQADIAAALIRAHVDVQHKIAPPSTVLGGNHEMASERRGKLGGTLTVTSGILCYFLIRIAQG